MKNKYFILVLTFLSLLIGQNSFAQDWQDMGFDDATNDLIQDFEDQGGTVDYYDNAQDYADAVNNDDNPDNDYDNGDDNNYNDSNNDNTGVAYWTDSSGINMYSDGEGRTYADMNNDGIFQPTEVVDDSHNSGSSNNSSDDDNDDNNSDIYDGLLDTHNYDNDTGTQDDDQYPYPDDTNNNDDTPTNDIPTPDAPPTRRAWYLDNDGDGYYISYVVAINKPDGNYKETSRGPDCDDNNYSKNLGTDCGWKIWYLDEDEDQYHSDETEQADSPGIGWVLTTRGVDCEESDPDITDQCRRKTWYFDGDGDEYHSNEMVSADYPGDGWFLTTMGNDCNDMDPAKTVQCGPSTCKGCLEDPVQNLINKPVLTQAELTKLIKDLTGRYSVDSKYNHVLTTSNGIAYKGTLTRLKDPSTGHSFYYFMPYTSGDLLKVGNQYKIPEPGSSGTSTTTGNPTVPGTLDYHGFPMGFYTMGTNNGYVGVYLTENNEYLENYCEGCEKIEYATDPKYPQLAKLLPKVKTLILGNTTILNNLMQLSGYNATQLANLLSEESLKKIMRVADIPDWGLYERYVTPDIFFVKAKLVASLETGGFKEMESNVNLNDTSFFLAIVIAHELVHFGRHFNNLPQRVTINNKTFEAGEVFETNIFRKVLGSSNIENLAKQYGWRF
ncbi:MAG: hypothetical protein ABI576_00455 [Flavobacterium sp.]